MTKLKFEPYHYNVIEVVAFPDESLSGPSSDDLETTWCTSHITLLSTGDYDEAVRYLEGLPTGTQAYIERVYRHQEIVWKEDRVEMCWKKPILPLHPHREPSFEPLSDGRHVLPDLNVEVTVENGVHTLRPLEESDTVRQCSRCGRKHPMDEMLRFVDVDTEKDVYICWSCWMGGSQ